MEKKPGQISSNTLGLRFMQNAARAKEERQMEAAKARVRTEEEWEVATEVRKGWGVEGDGEEEGRRVSYEPSYLPFLFPGLESANSSMHTAAAIIKTTKHTSDSDEESGELEESIVYKGRRKFGKHGREEKEETTPSSQMPPPIQDGTLPRGARSISSHGRAAASSSSSKSSKYEHRGPPPQQRPPSHPPSTNPAPNSIPAPPREFMKPQVDAPRSGARKRRSEEEDAAVSHSHSHGHGHEERMDGLELERGERKKKKRKEGIRE